MSFKQLFSFFFFFENEEDTINIQGMNEKKVC